MEEDILRFIESDSFKFLIAEEAADEIEELDVKKKGKKMLFRGAPTFGKRTGARCCHGRYRNLEGQENLSYDNFPKKNLISFFIGKFS